MFEAGRFLLTCGSDGSNVRPMETTQHDDLVTIEIVELVDGWCASRPRSISFEPSPSLCGDCHGYGKMEHPNGGPVVCPICNGEGVV